jgi:DNA-binding MarR family transcriptional regulator
MARQGDRPEVTAEDIARGLTRAARRHRAAIAIELSALGLFPGQEQVIRLLSGRDSATMSEIAEELEVRPPTASKMIARLAAQGFVTRKGNDGDQRVIVVSLSEAGRERAAAVEDAIRRVGQKMTETLDAKDFRRLRKLLKRLSRNLGDPGEEPQDDPED